MPASFTWSDTFGGVNPLPANGGVDDLLFGVDIACVTDIGKTSVLVGGFINLGYALARRLMTPRGGLFYDPDYGTDVREFLNETIDDPQLKAIDAAIKGELEKDPRVLRAKGATTFNYQTMTLISAIEIETAEGPFDLVLGISSLTVSILGGR